MEKRLYQTLMIGLQGLSLSSQEKAYLNSCNPGGIILFNRNCQNPTQVSELCGEIYANSEITPFIAIDEEGGLVSRLRNLYSPLPSVEAFGRSSSISTIERYGKLSGNLLRALGINLNLAPVVDIRHTDADNALLERYWGSNSGEVVANAGAYLHGLLSSGVHGCLKHFPGLGRATLDSHYALPEVDCSLFQLRSRDIIPFKVLHKSVQMVMISHCSFPLISESAGIPCSADPQFYRELRENIGFDGIVIADDLGMQSISDHFSPAETISNVLGCGATMLPFCNDPGVIESSFALLEAAVDVEDEFARITARAAERILRIKRKLGLKSELFTADPGLFESAARGIEELRETGGT